MPIYKYTMKKYMKSSSTWIILVITAVIMFFITRLAFNLVLKEVKISPAQYNAFSKSLFAGTILMIILAGSIFIGFKGGQVYKDEVEDGTFLIILSKPQTRSRIIAFKWLALFTVTLLFLVVLLFSLALGVIIFGRQAIISDGKNISIYHNLFKDIAILFAVGLAIVLILSSISLIISTKVSTGGTIGITIGIGVAVQITGIIGQFAGTTSYNTSYLQKNIYSETESLISRINISRIKTQLPKLKPKQIKGVKYLVNELYSSIISNKGVTIKTPKQPITLKGVGLGFTGINVNEHPSFTYLSYMDLSYQAALLGNIATDVTTPSTDQSNGNAINAATGKGGPGGIKKQKYVSTYNSTNFKDEILTRMGNDIRLINSGLNTLLGQDIPWINFSYFINLNNLESASNAAGIPVSQTNHFAYKNLASQSTPYLNTDEDTKIQNIMSLLAKKSKIDKIEYVDFINKYAILTAYISIAIILIPSSYYLLKRQDFR